MAAVRRGATIRGAFGGALSDLLEALGPTYIKIGQMLSARPDLLSPEIIAGLRRLQRHVAPGNPAAARSHVEETFGRPIGELFAAYDATPIASASIATVHRARLHDGRDVVLKIRRRDVERRIRADLAILGALAHALQRIPGMRTIPIRGFVDEFGTALLEQIDFTAELQSMLRMRTNFARLPQIVMPAPIPELCRESVITMEFLADLEPIGARELFVSEREYAARGSLRALYKMIFVDGFVHCDLHPGNLFVLSGGRVAIVDFGFMLRLSPQEQQTFSRFFFSMVVNDGPTAARILVETATYIAPGFEQPAFADDVGALLHRNFSISVHDFEVSRFAFELFSLQRRHGLRAASKYMMIILSLVMFEGIVKQLFPDLDFQFEARRFLPAIIGHANAERNVTATESRA